MNNKEKRKRWWFNGAFGALLLGSGISLAIDASHWKFQEYAEWHWIIGGTAGIGLVVSGVVLLIRAGILRRELDKEKEEMP